MTPILAELLTQTPDIVIPADSVPSVKDELGALKALPFDELLNTLVSNVVHFAISLAVAIAVFYIGKFIIRKLYSLVASILLRRKVDLSLSTFILSLVRIVLYFILIVTVISILGINTSSFIAIFASAGVAIGMALSGTLQNFAGGVLILLLKPYRIGDYIEAQGFAGTVTEIQIFSTIISTPDNKSIIIPNGGLSTGSINNWSREDHRRVDWEIAISYGDSVETARRAILDMLASDPRILTGNPTNQTPTPLSHPAPDRSPSVNVAALADSSVNLKIRAWVKTPDYWPVFFLFNERFYTELPTHGIRFPFPQLDVHLTN